MMQSSPSGLLPRVTVNVVFVASLVAVYWLDRHEPSDAGAATSGLALRFEEVSKAAGIDFVHHPFAVDPRIQRIEPHVSGLGSAVSLVDFDGDGFQDVFTTSSRAGTANGLFHNRGDGTFEAVPGAGGLDGNNSVEDGYSMGGIFADLDGDSDRDAFLYKFGRQHLYRNDGGRFVDVSDAAGVAVTMNAPTATFFDYDRDGDLDLYVGGYFRDDIDLARLTSTNIMQSSFEFASNGGRNRLFRNEGGLRFQDVTEGSGIESTRWTLAVAACDFDGDGWQDIYLANDYGPEELFLNRGGKDGAKFEPAAKDDLFKKSKSGMCVAVGDFKNEGRPSVFITNICRAAYLFQGNNLRWNHLATTGRFQNIADDRNVADCGWAWGAQFGDLDNDGWQDLVVVNGFISQSRERDYWFDMSKITGATSDAFEDATNWPAIGDKSLSGYEQSRVLLNVRGETFRDVATRVGVDDLYDGRGVAMGDLSNRGRLDFVVANRGGPLLVYRNVGTDGAHWIQFRLVGRGSNRDAVGACVRLALTGQDPCRFVLTASGFAAQNDPRLHFGLGAVDSVPRAIIRWPDGREQTIENPPIDRLNVVEEPAP